MVELKVVVVLLPSDGLWLALLAWVPWLIVLALCPWLYVD